ncbi:MULTISPECIES: hypothetical protein [Vagococcus]|uniref:Uncharacterized protein n=1 Tax=Vagococcus fluvialis bH819 TaxID=1255619 RepID=A0A1X6WPZ2_9ENTE|nr:MULTISPECIES: hypothetical protein [Vagococcus]SLM86355.1 hypothetical protein FM121_09710 [Vagococcus fluvialis bH819]HCM89010.1 hypothetical protein [Vagococcus sp.]
MADKKKKRNVGILRGVLLGTVAVGVFSTQTTSKVSASNNNVVGDGVYSPTEEMREVSPYVKEKLNSLTEDNYIEGYLKGTDGRLKSVIEDDITKGATLPEPTSTSKSNTNTYGSVYT